MTIQILQGDCIEMMRSLPDCSVHTCVTSPPYYGLRDYDVEGQIGLEETPDEFVKRLVEVFREVRRILRDDGTLWVNIGDTWAANRSYQVVSTKGGKKHGEAQSVKGKGSKVPIGLKPKDLIGVPWRLAFALQDDGWYLRQEIIWHKPNSMPESVKDRCSKAHEQIFLLSKSQRYYFDYEAIKEPAIGGAKGSSFNKGKTATHQLGRSSEKERAESDLRSRRSVWSIPTVPFRDAHFATFPPNLVAPCILAGAPEGGIVLDPFGGSGTTAQVSSKYGRSAILCELNPDYVRIAERRLGISTTKKRLPKLLQLALVI